MAYIGKQPTVGNFQVCDAITVVNGQAAYTMQVSSANVEPENANHMLVSLNGVLQKPGSSFTISGATITFASNLATGDVIDFIILLGNVLDIGTPSDGTVTNAKLAQDIISGETALTVSPDTTDEVLISNAGTLNRADISVLGNSPAFKVTLSGNQTLSDDTLTRVTWDTEEYDTANAFASNVFTVPSGEGGKYVFEFHVFGDDIDDGDTYSTYLEKNGTSILGSNAAKRGSGGTQNCEMNNIVTETCSAGDVIEVVAKHQGTGGSQVIRSNASFFLGYKLIGV